MVQFIPKNLDIEILQRDYSPIDFTSFKTDTLIHVIHLISAIPANNKDLTIYDGFVPVHSTTIKKRINNYAEYLRYLVDCKVLECDCWHMAGEKSKGYKFTEQYRTDLKSVEISDFTLVRNIEKRNANSGRMAKKYDYLMKWFNPLLRIDGVRARKFAAEEYRRKKNNRRLWDIDLKTKKPKDPYTQYTSSMMNTGRIEHNDYSLLVDENVGRFHSNLTNLKSEYRNLMTYDGKPLVSVDIKNSQPYISTLPLSKKFWILEPNHHFPSFSFNIQGVSSTLIDRLFWKESELTSYIMLLDSAESNASGDFGKFINFVTNGTLYEFLAEVIESELHIVYSDRKKLKGVVFQVLFTDNRFIGQDDAAPKRIFKNNFPDVYKAFSMIKRHGKALLPCLLQKIESHIMLERIAKRIANERPDLPIFTIHDSIATTVGNEGYVRRIMEEELTACIGYAPTLSTEYWKPENMKHREPVIYVGEQAVA